MTDSDIYLMSFDIGIKNMAYCVLTSIEDKISILDWQILDISSIDKEKNTFIKKCSCYNSLNNICSKKAKYQKDDMFYCEKHAVSTKDAIIRLKNFEIKNIKKLKVKDVLNLGIELKILRTEDTKIPKKNYARNDIYIFRTKLLQSY